MEKDKGQALRVSVALHIAEPSEDGNQRDSEARYGGYNRQYVFLEMHPEGGVIERADVIFPEVQNHAEVITHFSFGDPNGGAIIAAFPIDPPITLEAGTDNVLPSVHVLMAGVKLAKLQALGMVDADGNIITDRKPPASNIGGLTAANATNAVK